MHLLLFFTAKSNFQLKKCSLTSLKLLVLPPMFSNLFSILCLDEKAKAPGRYLSVLLKMLYTSAKCLESCVCFYQRYVFLLWSYQAHQFSPVSKPPTAFWISFPGRKVLMDIFHQKMQFIVIQKFSILEEAWPRIAIICFPKLNNVPGKNKTNEK